MRKIGPGIILIIIFFAIFLGLTIPVIHNGVNIPAIQEGFGNSTFPAVPDFFGTQSPAPPENDAGSAVPEGEPDSTISGAGNDTNITALILSRPTHPIQQKDTTPQIVLTSLVQDTVITSKAGKNTTMAFTQGNCEITASYPDLAEPDYGLNGRYNSRLVGYSQWERKNLIDETARVENTPFNRCAHVTREEYWTWMKYTAIFIQPGNMPHSYNITLNLSYLGRETPVAATHATLVPDKEYSYTLYIPMKNTYLDYPYNLKLAFIPDDADIPKYTPEAGDTRTPEPDSADTVNQTPVPTPTRAGKMLMTPLIRDIKFNSNTKEIAGVTGLETYDPNTMTGEAITGNLNLDNCTAMEIFPGIIDVSGYGLSNLKNGTLKGMTMAEVREYADAYSLRTNLLNYCYNYGISPRWDMMTITASFKARNARPAVFNVTAFVTTSFGTHIPVISTDETFLPEKTYDYTIAVPILDSEFAYIKSVDFTVTQPDGNLSAKSAGAGSLVPRDQPDPGEYDDDTMGPTPDIISQVFQAADFLSLFPTTTAYGGKTESEDRLRYSDCNMSVAFPDIYRDMSYGINDKGASHITAYSRGELSAILNKRNSGNTGPVDYCYHTSGQPTWTILWYQAILHQGGTTPRVFNVTLYLNYRDIRTPVVTTTEIFSPQRDYPYSVFIPMKNEDLDKSYKFELSFDPANV